MTSAAKVKRALYDANVGVSFLAARKSSTNLAWEKFDGVWNSEHLEINFNFYGYFWGIY